MTTYPHTKFETNRFRGSPIRETKDERTHGRTDSVENNTRPLRLTGNGDYVWIMAKNYHPFEM